MKKKLAMFLSTIILSAIAITTLIACAPAKYDVEVFIFDYQNAFMSRVMESMQKEFDKLDIKVKFNDGKAEQTTQTQSIDTAIANGTKTFVINPVDPKATSEIQEKIKKAGAKAIYVNKQDPEYDYKANDTTYIGSDLDGGGAIQGQIVADFFKTGGKYRQAVEDAVTAGSLDEVHIHAFTMIGEPGHPDAEYRTKSWIVEARKQLEDVTIGGANIIIDYDSTPGKDAQIMPDGANWSLSGARKLLDTIKNSNGFTKPGVNAGAAHKEYNIVLANNDDMALGAVEGLGSQATTEIPVIGVDATEPAVESIKNGGLTATVKQDINGIALCSAVLAKQMLDGKDASNILEGTDYTADKYKDKSESKDTIGVDYTAKANVVRLNYQEYKA